MNVPVINTRFLAEKPNICEVDAGGGADDVKYGSHGCPFPCRSCDYMSAGDCFLEGLTLGMTKPKADHDQANGHGEAWIGGDWGQECGRDDDQSKKSHNGIPFVRNCLRNAIEGVVEWRFHALFLSKLKRVVRSVGVCRASTDQDMKATVARVQWLDQHCACPFVALELPMGVQVVPYCGLHK